MSLKAVRRAPVRKRCQRIGPVRAGAALRWSSDATYYGNWKPAGEPRGEPSVLIS